MPRCINCGKPTDGRWSVPGEKSVRICGSCLQVAVAGAPDTLSTQAQRLAWLKSPAGRKVADSCRQYPHEAFSDAKAEDEDDDTD